MRGRRDFDTLLLIATGLLCAIGLSLIYSVFHPGQTGSVEGESSTYFSRQLLWMGFGVIALLIGYAIPFRYFETLAYVSYFLCLVLLVLVLFIGSGAAGRWIEIGPVRIQPSEFAKIALLLVWGRVLAGQRGHNRPSKVLPVLGLLIVPFLLVLKQPDLGTAIVFFVMLLPVLYWRGVKGHLIFYTLSPFVAGLLILYGEELGTTRNPWPFGIYIVLIFVVAYIRRSNLQENILLVGANLGVGLFLPIVWGNLKAYQQRRLLNFLDPEVDKLSAGWQVFQSKIAIGSGGLTGKGYMEGTQKALEFLPAKHTDFIFSVLGEEVGFAGALFVLFLFAVLIYRALIIAAKAKSEFASTVCLGIATYFFFQVVTNVAMTIGMAPVAGIPLPFLSYGGSSLVVSCFFVGFLLNCSVRWYEY
ncbi:MAG: rod shape-determining protein RodA [bacterium]|nr:rod shape-determining protein RodA [bacterium]